MEMRTLTRKNTLGDLNRKTTIKINKSTTKINKGSASDLYAAHPARYLVRSDHVADAELKKYMTLLYRGLNYSLKNLKGPSEAFISKKKVYLSETKRKF